MKTMMKRRNFLKSSLGSLAGVTTMGSVGLNLSMMNIAQASTKQFTDYKALVCVFLFGGNDSFNMLIPTDKSAYKTYKKVRQNMAYNRNDLIELSRGYPSGLELGVPNALEGIHQLYEKNQLAFVMNTGPLVGPVTKKEAQSNPASIPLQLFSHNDQQKLWQSALADGQNSSGWAGRIADLIMDPNNSLSMNLTLNGSNLFQTGINSQAFALDSSGPQNIESLDPKRGGNQFRYGVFEQLNAAAQHPLEKGFRDVFRRAVSNNELIAEALKTVPESQYEYPMSNNPLSPQLKLVAKLAKAHQKLGHQRQVFFVGLPGWDTHDNQSKMHPTLLSRLSGSLSAFQKNLDQLGLSKQVTTFTLSDFGRTLTSNGDGTDHGWGGHQMVMGGAVRGGKVYGQMPDLALNSKDDIGGGRVIPSLSVDQYASQLARWFGLSESEIKEVFPNLYRFDQSPLGFV